MNYPTEFNVKVGAKDYNKFDMSKIHHTTMDFGTIKPIECKYCIPGDKINLKLSQLTKVLTMPCPTYGKADIVLRSFYVPINNIWNGFNDFIAGNKVPMSDQTLISERVPFMYLGDIVRILYFDHNFSSFIGNIFTYETDDSDKVDINFEVYTYHPNDHTFTYNHETAYFSYLGRKFYDFLVSMGLKFPPVIFRQEFEDGDESSYNSSFLWNNYTNIERYVNQSSDQQMKNAFAYAKEKISLLPIMAFWKFYIDWIVPSRFLANYTKIRYVLDAKDKSEIPYISLVKFFGTLPVSFLQDDFFTTLFSNPAGVESSSVQNLNVEVPNPNYALNAEYFDSVSVVNNQGSLTRLDDSYINMFTLRTLGALQDMVNRGKISGSKVKDYLESTFGIRASDDALHISTYLGSQRVPINFESIQTATDTYVDSSQGALPGQYFGTAKVANEPFTISFDVKDKMHGFFFVTAEIQVKTSYTQGLMPEFTMIDKFDFFEPSMDSIDLQPISRRLLCNMEVNGQNYAQYLSRADSNPDKIFGWASRYAPLKCNFDNISGDFIIKSLNTGLDSWYLSRLFNMARLSQDYPEINEKFLQAISQDTNEGYDRIFSIDNPSIDHFRITFNFDLTMERKMKSLRDSLEFEEGGKTISKSVNNGVQN